MSLKGGFPYNYTAEVSKRPYEAVFGFYGQFGASATWRNLAVALQFHAVSDRLHICHLSVYPREATHN